MDPVRSRSAIPPHFHILTIALDSRPSGRDFLRMKSANAMPLCVNWQNKSNSASTTLTTFTQPNHP
jgi:hypothetical protein